MARNSCIHVPRYHIKTFASSGLGPSHRSLPDNHDPERCVHVGGDGFMDICLGLGLGPPDLASGQGANRGCGKVVFIRYVPQ